MKTLTYVIANNGDGSNSLEWVIDPAILAKMEKLANEGDEQYASGDGLQVKTFKFPDDFDLDSWVQLNHISITTMEEFMEYR